MLEWLHKARTKDSTDARGVAIDPVCGMGVQPGHAVATRKVDEQVFYFCSERCVEEFDRDAGSTLSITLTR